MSRIVSQHRFVTACDDLAVSVCQRCVLPRFGLKVHTEIAQFARTVDDVAIQVHEQEIGKPVRIGKVPKRRVMLRVGLVIGFSPRLDELVPLLDRVRVIADIDLCQHIGRFVLVFRPGCVKGTVGGAKRLALNVAFYCSVLALIKLQQTVSAAFRERHQTLFSLSANRIRTRNVTGNANSGRAQKRYAKDKRRKFCRNFHRILQGFAGRRRPPACLAIRGFRRLHRT